MSARRICIVGLDSYGHVVGRGRSEVHRRRVDPARVAGARLARSRPRRLDHRARRRPGRSAACIDGITAIAAHTRHGGIRGLRFFHPRATRPAVRADRARTPTSTTSRPRAPTPASPAGSAAPPGGGSSSASPRTATAKRNMAASSFWRDRKLYNYGLRRADLSSRRRPSSRRRCCARTTASRAAVVNMMVEPPRAQRRGREGHRRAVGQQPARAQASGAGARARASVAGGEVHAGGRTDARRRDLLRRRDGRGRAPAQRHHARARCATRRRARCSIARRSSSTPPASRDFPTPSCRPGFAACPVVTFFDPDALVQRLPLGPRRATRSTTCARRSAACSKSTSTGKLHRAACARIRHARIHHAAWPRDTSNYSIATHRGCGWAPPETQ